MTSLTLVNSLRQIADFVDYVDSFYGTNDPLYPLFLNGKALTKEHIRHATIVYLDRCNNDDFELCTWGDGDSLDRERVRDFVLQRRATEQTATSLGF